MSWWNLAFRSQLPEIVKREFEHARALVNGFLSKEHNADGSHGDITRNGRPLVTPWTPRPFDANDFVGVAPMGWTVAQGSVLTHTYKIIDDTMTLVFCVNGSTLTGTPSAMAKIRIPEGYLGQAITVEHCRLYDNAVPVDGICYSLIGDPYIYIAREDQANMTVVANGCYAQARISFQINR